MTFKKLIEFKINQIAETHHVLKPILEKALRNTKFTPEALKFVGNFETYYDKWRTGYGDRFFDMATFLRLGSVIEIGLRDYYMYKNGYSKISDLSGLKNGVFQRVIPSASNNVIDLYKDDIKYDLNKNMYFKKIQIIMQHRHLYAHNLGLIDKRYIDQIKILTGEDIQTSEALENTKYPDEDCYYFKPLNELSDFICDTRRFFNEFP